MGKPNENGMFMDSLADFAAGMNSDVPPTALPKNQLAFATNATLRGNYFTHRPSYRDITISFSDSSTQESFEKNLWQGASYYKPDSGSENIIASIGGRLYKVTPSSFGSDAEVIDISAPGSLNNPSTSQAWLWQGENFLFCNDGESSGLIFNGNITRRLDSGTTVGTTSGAVAIPALNGTVTVTLAANYTGEYGVAVHVLPTLSSQNLIGQFQVNPVGGSYRALLTNVNGTPGLIIPAGTQLISNPSIIAKTTSVINVASNSSTCFVTYTWNIDRTYNWNTTSTLAQSARSPNEFWSITDSNGVARTFGAQTGPATTGYTTCFGIPVGTFTITPGTMVGWVYSVNPAFTIPVGTTITKVGSPAATTVATVSTTFTSPATGGSIEISLESPYSGTDGAEIYISGDKYLITAIVPASSNQVTLTALSLAQATGQIPSGAILKTLQELPPGKMGAYGLGRNWICLLDGISYLASDIVGGSSGTVSNSFRDSILNVTENNFLAGGGVFRVPSSGQQINALRFPATLDSSLGQGPLQVLTQNTTFSCNAPVQRSVWQDLTNPIQTQSLVGGGALSQNSTVAVNGDLFFRSLDGIRSLRLARQDFQTSYSNTPQSVEMNRVLQEDDRSLLGYSSAIVFDNRLLMTAAPTKSQVGVYHTKLIALNLDPNSSLRVKQPPIYDGAWDGINVLQLIVGTFNGIERAFAFTYDTDTTKIGLTEILPTSSTNNFDNETESIVFSFESPALFYQPDTAARQLLRLNDGEIIVKDINGDCRFDVYYRPDYDDTWKSWHSWEVTDSPNYQPRMGLGQPNLKLGDTATGRPFAVGYSFQIKVVVTGSCVVMGMNFYAVSQPTPQFAKPLESLTPLAT